MCTIHTAIFACTECACRLVVYAFFFGGLDPGISLTTAVEQQQSRLLTIVMRKSYLQIVMRKSYLQISAFCPNASDFVTSHCSASGYPSVADDVRGERLQRSAIKCYEV